MAQTTAAVDRASFKVETSNDGSTWTDISGAAATVQTSGGDQLIGSQNTADGNAPVVVGSTKTQPFTVTVSCVYTETASQPFELVESRFFAATKTIYLRWSPRGGASGEKQFTCTNGAGTAFACPIQSVSLPDLDAGSGDVAMFSFAVQTPYVTIADVA
jgi:hypothetical protein